MERIRLGNNIAISWALYDLNGRIHSLEDKEVQLYVSCGGLKQAVTDYTIQGNVVSWVFLGTEQEKVGLYKLILVETDALSGAQVVDVAEAFRLVSETLSAVETGEVTKNISVRSVLTYSNLVGVESVDVVESSEDGGTNLVSIRLVDGNVVEIPIKNGSKGDTGATGATGATGPKGDKGDIGERGPAGITSVSAAIGTNDPTQAPSVNVAGPVDGALGLTFNNIKGAKGDQGEPSVAVDKFVTVEATAQTTAATDVLPATGDADTVYRVANWDGTQYDDTAYTEYGWYNGAYKQLATRTPGIDDEPTANSQNLVKSGGVAAQISQLGQELNGENVFNYQSGKALNSDNSVYDDEDWGVSEYVPYELGTGIIWNYGQKKANHNLLFYNSAKEYITGAYWAATSDSGQTSINASSIQQYAPNAAFIRASFLLSNPQAGLSSGGNVIWSPQNIHQKGLKEDVVDNTTDILSLYNRLETLLHFNSSMNVRRYLMDNAPYYFDIPNNLSSYDEDNYLDQRIKETPVERQFLFFTDTHQQNTSNCKISSVIEYVKNRLAIPLSVFGGDAIEIYTGDDANYEALANVGNLASEYCSAGGSGFLWVEGNHDANSPGHNDSTIANNYLINDYEEYLRTTRNMPASVHFYDEALEYSSSFLTDADIASFITSFEAEGGTFEADGYSGPTFNGEYVQQLFIGWCRKNYYYDDTKNKIRYLVLDTRDGSIFARMTNYTNSYILVDFVESTLNTIPEGYSLVVLGHQWGNDNNNSPLFSSGDSNLCNLVYQMLLAYKSKGSFTFSPYLYQNYYLGAKWWKAKYGNAGSKTYTFSDCKAEKIIVLGGHYHFDCAWKVYHSSGTTLAADEIDNGTTIASDEILVVWTHRATYGASSYDPVQQAGLQYARSYSMENGTITEYAFDVATIMSDRIHFTRYGAGVDREYVFQS